LVNVPARGPDPLEVERQSVGRHSVDDDFAAVEGVPIEGDVQRRHAQDGFKAAIADDDEVPDPRLARDGVQVDVSDGNRRIDQGLELADRFPARQLGREEEGEDHKQEYQAGPHGVALGVVRGYGLPSLRYWNFLCCSNSHHGQ